MEFVSFGNELEIRLSARDAEKLGFDFSGFDCKNERQKNTLLELLSAAEAETGVFLSRERLTVHLYRRKAGEMSFFLREEQEEKPLFYVYVFEDFDALCRARERLLPLCGLYRKNDVFFGVSTSECEALLEYASRVKRITHLFSFLEGARRIPSERFT